MPTMWPATLLVCEPLPLKVTITAVALLPESETM